MPLFMIKVNCKKRILWKLWPSINCLNERNSPLKICKLIAMMELYRPTSRSDVKDQMKLILNFMHEWTLLICNRFKTRGQKNDARAVCKVFFILCFCSHNETENIYITLIRKQSDRISNSKLLDQTQTLTFWAKI